MSDFYIGIKPPAKTAEPPQAAPMVVDVVEFEKWAAAAADEANMCDDHASAGATARSHLEANDFWPEYRPDEAPALRAEVERLEADLAYAKAHVATKEEDARRATALADEYRSEAMGHAANAEAATQALDDTRKVCREVAASLVVIAHALRTELHDVVMASDADDVIAALRQAGGAE